MPKPKPPAQDPDTPALDLDLSKLITPDVEGCLTPSFLKSPHTQKLGYVMFLAAILNRMNSRVAVTDDPEEIRVSGYYLHAHVYAPTAIDSFLIGPSGVGKSPFIDYYYRSDESSDESKDRRTSPTFECYPGAIAKLRNSKRWVAYHQDLSLFLYMGFEGRREHSDFFLAPTLDIKRLVVDVANLAEPGYWASTTHMKAFKSSPIEKQLTIAKVAAVVQLVQRHLFKIEANPSLMYIEPFAIARAISIIDYSDRVLAYSLADRA